MSIVLLNETFIDESDASISIFDRGFIYGDGIFEIMRAYGRKIFRFEEHINRLFSSAEKVWITLDIDKHKLMSRILELLRRNNMQNALVRVIITRGIRPSERSSLSFSRPTIVVVPEEPLEEKVPGIIREYRVVTVNLSEACGAPFSPVRSISNQWNFLARYVALERGADEGVLVTPDNCIAQGAHSNIFFIDGDYIITPPLNMNIHPGITRSIVLALARNLGFETNEEMILSDSVAHFQGAFLTSTPVEIMPITEYNGYRFEHFQWGETVEKLQRAFTELVRRESAGESRRKAWYDEDMETPDDASGNADFEDQSVSALLVDDAYNVPITDDEAGIDPNEQTLSFKTSDFVSPAEFQTDEDLGIAGVDASDGFADSRDQFAAKEHYAGTARGYTAGYDRDKLRKQRDAEASEEDSSRDQFTEDELPPYEDSAGEPYKDEFGGGNDYAPGMEYPTDGLPGPYRDQFGSEYSPEDYTDDSEERPPEESEEYPEE